MKIRKTSKELLNGVNEIILLIDYYKKGLSKNIEFDNLNGLESQVEILKKVEVLEEALRLFGINSYEYADSEVILSNLSDDESDYLLAIERLKNFNPEESIAREELMRRHGITQEDIDSVDDVDFE